MRLEESDDAAPRNSESYESAWIRSICETSTPSPSVPGDEWAAYPGEPTIGGAGVNVTIWRDAPGVLTFEILSDTTFAAV